MEIQHKNKPPTMEKKKKVWSNDETLGFLYCYFARKHEFQQKGYQKCAYENVLKDMIDQGFTNSSTTITALRYRMRHLLVSYREVIKNPHKLENNANIIHLYMNEMDAIFGGQDLINDTVEGDSEELEKVDAPLVMPMVKICVDSPVFKVHPVNNKSTHIDSSCEDLSQSSLCLNNFTAEEQQLHMQLCPKIEITETDEETALETKGNYWSRENVLLLLNCYNARKDDFNIKGKKKYAYENLLKDMIEKGFTYSAPNVSCVRSKLRKLLSDYRSAKMDPKKGETKENINNLYFKEMDAIFGDQTTMNKSTEVDCFVGVFKKTPVAPKINIKTRSRATKTSQQTNSTDKDEPDISSQSQPSHHSKKTTDEDELQTPSQHSENIDKGTSLTPIIHQSLRKTTDEDELHTLSQHFENMDEGTPHTPIVHRSPRQTTDEDEPHIQSKHSLNMDGGTPLKPTIHGSRRKATDGDDTHTLLQHSENIDEGTLLTPIIHGSQKTSDEDEFSEEQQLHVQLCPKEETTKTETKGKCWSREETLGLLKCYSARKDDFNIKGKKKYAYENLLKDMIEKGFTHSTTSLPAVVGKMRKLLYAYESAKNDPKKAETKESINNLYFKEMDAIFGDQPRMNKSTEGDSFVAVFKKKPVSPKINFKTRSSTTKTSHQTNSTDKDEPDTSSQSKPSQHSKNMDEGTPLTPMILGSPRKTTDEDESHTLSHHFENMDEGTPQTTIIHGSPQKTIDEDEPHSSSQHSENIDEETPLTLISHESARKTNNHSLLGKRKAAEEIYFAKKLKLKREEIRDRKLAREANHNQREKFMRTYLDGLQNKWKKDQELEMRKLELLEKLINKK